MATFLPLLGSLRGRLGDNVFSHNKGGDYVRRGTTPTNPMTERQQVTRTLLGNFAQHWSNSLEQAQRDAWDTYAEGHPVKNSLGQDVYITGLSWYVGCNSKLTDAGLAPVTDPPATAGPSGLITLSVDISAATTLDITFTPALVVTDVLAAWVSLPVTAGATPNFRQCRLAGYSAASQASPWAATTPHAFQVGERVVAYVGVLDDQGLTSSYMQATDVADYV